MDCYCRRVKATNPGNKCDVCKQNESEARENTPNKKKRRRPSTSDKESYSSDEQSEMDDDDGSDFSE